MLIPLVCAEVKDTGVNIMKVGVNNRAKIGVKTQNLAWGLKKDRAFPPPPKCSNFGSDLLSVLMCFDY